MYTVRLKRESFAITITSYGFYKHSLRVITIDRYNDISHSLTT